MDFTDVVNLRCSIRAYADKPIEEEVLQKILEVANRAPSAGNLQAYEIYVVSDRALKIALAKAAYNQDFVSSAPVVLVFCANPRRSEWRYGQRGARLYCVQDATIACTCAMLAATDLGLGSVWVGAFDDEIVHNLLGAEKDLIPVAILPIGYPAEEPTHRPRRELRDIVHWV